MNNNERACWIIALLVLVAIIMVLGTSLMWAKSDLVFAKSETDFWKRTAEQRSTRK